MRVIGRRIAVYGPSGSGKSTFARTLGEMLDLPVVELDALFHKPNWQPTPVDEFKATVRDLLSRYRSGWVCDGNYRTIRQHVLPRADDIVWLRLPFPTVYWRLFYRTVTRAWSQEPLWGTNYESWRLSFLSRDSSLLWGIIHWRAHQRGVERDLREIHHSATVHTLRSPLEVERFLGSLQFGAVRDRALARRSKAKPA